MADSTYAGAAGFVQFDPNVKEANGQTIREVTIKAVGSQKLIKITLWPEWDAVAVAKGDFVAADGKFSQNLGQAPDGSPREYLGISASSLVVIPGAQKAERQVVQSSGGASAAASSEPLF